STVGIAEGTVGATIPADIAWDRSAGAGEVAAAAPRRRAVTLEEVAVRIIAVVLRIVLAWRDQRTKLETIEDRRFIPNRMVHPPIELGPVVAAGIAHDGIIVAERPRERIHRGGGLLVRRIALAGLDRAPRAFHAQEAVARPERSTLGWGGSYVDLRFQLGHDRHAVPAIGSKVVPDANAETRNIARDTEFRTLIEHGRIEDVGGHVDRSV